jgi:hypothetical protein
MSSKLLSSFSLPLLFPFFYINEAQTQNLRRVKKKGNIYHPKYDPFTTRKPKSKTSKEKKIKRKQ